MAMANAKIAYHAKTLEKNPNALEASRRKERFIVISLASRN
jgi:hypothetical protein